MSSGTFTTSQSLLLQLYSASGSFSLSQPLWTYRWGVGLRDSRTKEPEHPCPGPDTPSAVSYGPEKRGSAARGCPPQAPVSGTFLRGATRGCMGGGDCPCSRPTSRPPRNRPAWPWAPMASTYWTPLFHQQFKKSCQKQLCLTAMCSFFLPFFFIIKEGVKLARSPLHPLSQKEPNGYEKGGKKERTHTPISEGMPVRCGLYLNIQYVNGRGVGTYIKCRLHLIAPRSQL